jgi:lipopolysaccharide export system protein LptC
MFVQKNYYLFILTLGILILTAWTTYLTYKNQSIQLKKDSSLPDAFMDDVTAIVMDKFGKVKMKIITPKLTHFPQDDVSLLNNPELTIYRNSPNPWYITASFGKASQGTELVDFWDNVRIHHAADESNPATIIKTAMLTVHPNDNTAETKTAITLEQPSLKIKSIGMFADMNSGDIELLSDTRGEYLPNVAS